MSFCVSHRTALDKNIRHIYSGRPSDVRFRYYSNSADAALDVHDRVWERHKRPPGRFESKFQEYNPEYRTRMPRAPAFRHVSPEQVREITSRLTRPTLMTVLRQQPDAAGRSSSQSPRRDLSSRMTQRSDLDNDNSRHRKISYKEWSDDESGVYYIDDSTLADDNNQYQKDNDSDAGAKPIEWRDTPTLKRETLNGDVYENNGELFETQETFPEFTKDNEWEPAVEKENGYETNSKTATENEIRNPITEHSKGQPTQGKLNILEEIIQTKNTTNQRDVKNSSSSSPTGEKRKLEGRGRINNKINRSPYCEPAPLLTKMPPATAAQPGGRSKIARTPSPWMMKQGVGNDTRDLYSPFPARPQTRAGTGRSKRDPLTAQYRSPSRGTAVYLRPTRSSSAPGYKVHDDKRGIPKKREATCNGTKKQTTASSFKAPAGQLSNHKELKSTDDRRSQALTSKSPTENGRQSRQTARRHPSSKSIPEGRKVMSTKTTATTWETSRSLGSTPVDLRSRSALASRQSEASTRHSPRNSEEFKYTSCCMPAVENDLLVRFGVEPNGRRPFFVSNSKRRYASAAEMEAACRRLMAPTATQLIRDRMRWAPDNDGDLQDPVRVIRETVQTKSRPKRSKRKNGAFSGFDDDSAAQQEENADEEMKDNEDKDNNARTNKISEQRGQTSEGESYDEDNQWHQTNEKGNGDKSESRLTQEQSEEKNFRDNNLKQIETGPAIDFKDKDGAVVVTKSRDFGEDRDITKTDNVERSHDISAIDNPDRRSLPRSRSRSPSVSRSRSKSRSSSRSRPRSQSTSRSRSSSRSRSLSSSRSRSRSSSRARSRTVSRSRSRSRSRSSSRSDQRQRIQPLTNGKYNTKEESQWESNKADDKGQNGDSDGNTRKGEERGGELLRGHESRDMIKYDSVIEADPHSCSPGQERRVSEDDHGFENQIALPLSSLSRGEPREKDQTADKNQSANCNGIPERGDERGGDDCGRGRENRGVLQRQSYGTVPEARTDYERSRDLRDPSVPYNNTDGISYTVQKGYAKETEEGSSYVATDYAPNATGNDEEVGRSTYHRVTFEPDS